MPHFPKPFYRKPRCRWYVEINGKQVNLGPDRDEAFRTYHELMAVPESTVVRPVASQSVAALCDRFLDWVEIHRAFATFENYRYRLQRFVDRYPDLTVDDLRPFHVQEWADSYVFSQNSRRNYMRSIKTCLRWCCKQGYLDKNPLEHLALPAQKHREVYVPPEEFERLLQFVCGDALRDLIIVTYDVGCRPQECLRVERRHVESERQRWVFPPSEAKGRCAPRIVYLTERAMETTERLMVQNPVGPLFRNSRGNPWTTDAVNCSFDRIRLRMAKAEMEQCGQSIPDDEIDRVAKTLNPVTRVKGNVVKRATWQLRVQARQKLLAKRARQLVPRYSLYALRHSWATNALKRGLDSLTVAVLMGHQDPSTLAKVYQHLSHNPEHLLNEARRAVS